MKDDRLTFFRQSSWVLISTVVGGVFMALAGPIVAQRYMTGENEYGLFMAMLAALAQMGIPALGLQTVFVQQASAATTDEKRRELAGAVRSVISVLFVLWLVLILLAQLFEQRWIATYKITNPTTLWFTVDAALVTMVAPIFVGLLQGRQDFLWFGWISISNGVFRFVAMLVLILGLGFASAGAMAGVLVGLIGSLAFYMWRTKASWSGETSSFAWRPWLKRVVPMTLGLGTFTYLFTHDPDVVQRTFDKSSGYNAARQVGAALVFLTTPLAAVMFAKVARTHALSEKSNVLGQALGATGLLGAAAALACTFLPELPLRIMSGEKFIGSAPLVPWFAWCMLPLAIANVLMNNLLARERYAVVPWLLAVAIGYGITLEFRHATYLQVIQTLGIFSSLLAGVCVVFTLLTPATAKPTVPRPA